MKKLFFIVVIFFLAIGLFFSSNIYGYFRFKQYCSNEGGLKVYEKLEKNVGWLAKDKYDARAAALLSGVGFVRYTDKKDGKTYDIRYLGGNPQEDSSFEKLPSDESKLVEYVWKNINQPVENELRLMRYGEQILNISDNRILVYYYMLGYEKFNRRNTLLDMPSEIYCFNEPAKNVNEISAWVKALNTSFKN